MGLLRAGPPISNPLLLLCLSSLAHLLLDANLPPGGSRASLVVNAREERDVRKITDDTHLIREEHCKTTKTDGFGQPLA